MKELQERIKKDGNAINEDILKVDSFINHQVDPELMAHIGEEFANHFKDCGITKIATIESSGIAPALMTAQCMGLPLIILKKQPSKVLNDHLFQTEVTSFTKGTSYELTLSSKFISLVFLLLHPVKERIINTETSNIDIFFILLPPYYPGH